MEECARLRQQLEEVIKSKDTFADPQELKIIEQKFQQRDLVISQIQQENNQVVNALKTKDEENRQLAQLVQEMERRMKKAQSLGRLGQKLKKDYKENERQMHSMRKELIELREHYKSVSAKL